MITQHLKAGDIVRATGSSGGGGYTEGQCYTVKRPWYCSGDIYTVRDDHGSDTNGWGGEWFDYVPAPPIPGAVTHVLGTQIGGSHYTDCKIQPIEYIWANGLSFSEGNIIKYVTRWKAKGGIKDLEKAKHHLELLIEHEKSKA